MPSLEKYTGPWTEREAAHLLRRVCFGANKTQIQQAVSMGFNATIDMLFSPQPTPPDPKDPATGLDWTKGGDGYDQTKGPNYYNAITKSWWAELMIYQTLNVREKLTLFWSNHFSTEMSVVAQAIYSHKMLVYLRENSLKNFRALVTQITLEEGMLRYLNGNTNTKGSPNENYGRELQELFTIGKGEEVGPGDYTTYTESDVQAAAKVLTGWRDDRQTGKTVFKIGQHDTSNKQFSNRYQNTVIAGGFSPDTGQRELDELIDMILKQNATAEYIVKKLYIFYINSDVTETVVNDIIKPLAADLRTGNYEVEPVLRKLLSCAHVFDVNNFGSQLRSPADLAIHLMRTITTWTPPRDAIQKYRYFLGVATAMAAQQMDLGDAPSVAGWEAYYQEPGYYQAWLTTATLPLRNGLTDALFIPNRNNDRQPILDTVKFVKTFASPNDALALIDEANLLFFALPFSETLRMKLAEEVLMDGGRYYEWATVWEEYIATPNQVNTLKVKTSLDRLFTYMFRMAEFQLY